MFIGKTKNGFDVYVDLEASHAATHFKDDPQLLSLVKEALPELEPKGDYWRHERHMGRIVGNTDLVETGESDEIVYAKRPLRDVYTRFVKNKTSSPSEWITVELRKIDERSLELFTTWIGRLVPSFPGGKFETAESKPFWSKHALVWGKQDIVSGTETIECPW